MPRNSRAHLAVDAASNSIAATPLRAAHDAWTHRAYWRDLFVGVLLAFALGLAAAIIAR